MPVELDIASELRYRNAPMPPGGCMIVVSQSGETADTLAALRYAKEQGQKVIAVVNVPESSIAREADVELEIDEGYVSRALAGIAENQDLSRYVL